MFLPLNILYSVGLAISFFANFCCCLESETKGLLAMKRLYQQKTMNTWNMVCLLVSSIKRGMGLFFTWNRKRSSLDYFFLCSWAVLFKNSIFHGNVQVASIWENVFSTAQNKKAVMKRFSFWIFFLCTNLLAALETLSTAFIGEQATINVQAMTDGLVYFG